MSEEDKGEQATCECCNTCQVSDNCISEVRKFKGTVVDYLDSEDRGSYEEYLKTRYGNPPHLVKEFFIARPQNKFWEFLKYIFLFKWLKVTWK